MGHSRSFHFQEVIWLASRKRSACDDFARSQLAGSLPAATTFFSNLLLIPPYADYKPGDMKEGTVGCERS
jgi:hypothetical protein